MKITYCIVISALFAPFYALGQDSCEYQGQYAQNIDPSHPFRETIKAGIGYSNALCQSILELEGAADVLQLQYTADAWSTAALTEAKGLIAVQPLVNTHIEVLAQHYTRKMPKQLALSVSGRSVIINVLDNDYAEFDTPSACQTGYGNDCRPVLEAFQEAVNMPWYGIKQNKTAEAVVELELKSLAWQRYFDNRRSQTLIEVMVNTYAYRHALRSGKPIPPPEKQWIVFHPSIVLQNSPDEMDGSQLTEALAFEWLGINYWDLPVPLGVSLVSTYADRAQGSDLTHGVMLHIKNDYSIGITDIGDENNIFITVDVLKLFENQNTNFSAFVKSMWIL